jgi:LPXTG-site transpeptidase (sortase) family protein
VSPFSRRALAAFTAFLALAPLTGCAGGQGGGDTAPAPPTSSAPPAASTRTTAPEPYTGPVRPLARSVPTGLRVPAIGVDTPVMALGLEPDGTVQVPPATDDDRAGWYRHSPTPGQTGPSVVLGHVTVGTHGDGVFRRLARLHRGDRIEARLENGTVAVFTVTSVRTVEKERFPTKDVYGDVDRPELRLITCGGPHDGDGYRDNVIAFAELTGVATAPPAGPPQARDDEGES